MLSALSVCALGLLLLLADNTRERVGRAQTPATGPRLGVPDAPADEASPEAMEELEGELRRVADRHDGRYTAAVLDPATGEEATLNAGHRFYAASLAKLPVMITLYTAAARGDIDLREEISIRPSDVQSYGSGVLQNYPVGYTMTLRQCAAYLISESDNTAWVMLERRLGMNNIRKELRTIGATDTTYRTAAHYTTASDVLLMLRRIDDPQFTTPALSKEMLDHMTDTAHEARLPEPLPGRVRVAHKIGTYTNIYSDAGIVFHKSGKYLILVAAENASRQESVSAIREMSLAAYRPLADPRP